MHHEVLDKIAIGASSAILVAIVTYFLHRRKYLSEIRKIDIETINEAINVWQQSIEELKQERESLVQQKIALEEENQLLKEQKELLLQQSKEFRQLIEKIKKDGNKKES